MIFLLLGLGHAFKENTTLLEGFFVGDEKNAGNLPCCSFYKNAVTHG
jgi:hypothetical protein